MFRIFSINEISLSLKTCFKVASREVKSLIFFTFFLGVCAASIEFFFAVIIQDFFQHLGIFNTPETGFNFRSPSLEASMAYLVIIGFLRTITEGLKIFLSRMAQQRFAQHVRLKLITHALNNAGTLSSGKILSLFSDETARSSNSILNLSSLFIQIALSLTLLIFSLANFPQATLIGLFLLIVFSLPLRLFEKSISKTGLKLSEEWERTNYILTEGIRNNFYLRVIGKVRSEVTRAGASLENYFQVFRRAFFLISFKAAVPSFLGILILVIIAYLYKEHKLFSDNFSFIGFFYLFLRFTQASSQAVTLLSEFKINVESTKRLSKWLDQQTSPVIADAHPWPFNKSEPLSLKLEKLCFSYDKQTLFEKLSLELKKGEPLVITGESGVGKSTLLSLILGLLRPTAGAIYINEKSLPELRESLPSVTSYIGPHPYLVEGTLKDNLLYGVEQNCSEDEILKVLEKVQLRSLFEGLSDGLSTKMNEIGSNLSTGQKQRLMIARAILRNPQIVIMDEATANLDQATEAELIKNLEEFFAGRVSIIVTHKETFARIARHRLDLKKFT